MRLDVKKIIVKLFHQPHLVKKFFFSISLIVLLFVGEDLTIYKKDEVQEYMPEIYYSKNYPGCKYAVYRDPSDCDDTTILYYFHGSGGDESTWYKTNRKIIETWRKDKSKSPLVIAVTFGENWLMFPDKISEKCIHLDHFVHDIIPEIENHLVKKIIRRFLYGFSIGGANVTQLIFRYPDFFDKAVIISPQIYLFSIYAGDEEIDKYAMPVNFKISDPVGWIKRNILKRNSVIEGIHKELSLLKWNVPNSVMWSKANILTNMKHAPESKHISIYISCGKEDEFGFFPGTKKLASLASEKGYEVTFDQLEGGHLARNEVRIAEFLKR